MILNDIMKKRNLTKYRLSKNSGIPYSTLTDISTGKARLEKCSAETIYKLSKELQISMEDLLEPCFVKRCSFELFKSNVCHHLKELGDTDFIIDTLETNDIRKYYNRQWYPECFYLLAMLDYISRVNNIALCDEYNDLRHQSLTETLYPSSVITIAAIYKNNDIKKQACDESIPEFKRFNIIESDVRNVL